MPEIIDVEQQKDKHEIVIDWNLVKKVFKTRWKICGLIILLCALAAMALAFVVPKKFESEVLLRAKAKSNSSPFGGGAAAAILLGGSMPGQVNNYIELISSRAVIEPIIAKLDLSKEQRELMTVASFAKSAIKTDNAKGTDLLSITATGKTPAEAQMIAASVTENLSDLLTKLNRSEPSYMVKFLDERIALAKKDMDQAEQNLEKFRQQDKIFAPDEQARMLLTTMSAIDKLKAEELVKSGTADQALLQINNELKRQNVAMETYKITDNATVQQIRTQLIAKELQLLELQQKFTDEQPDVVNAKQSIAELKRKMDEELTKSLISGTTVMNPVHIELMKNKITAEIDAQSAREALSVLNSYEQQSMASVSKLSASGLTYIALARQEKLNQEIYLMLVKQYEQSKIQEAMDSMDVQIIDPANLPKRHVFPSKTLFTLVGGMLGGMLALLSLLVSYRKMARG